MKFYTSLSSVALASLLAACGASPSESPDSTAAALVSPTTSYLLPTDDGVREACRSTWTTQFCNSGDALDAGAACVKHYVAEGNSAPCAETSAGCFELYTSDAGCTGDRPIYESQADCKAPVERTCAFYSACLETDHACGESGYAIGYGEKYCSRYDVDNTFSREGIVWRNAVLHCLQESLVPELPIASTLTCSAITTFAFDSHPKCYTEGPSICFLPVSDVLNVVSVIDGKDLLSLQSADQMISVAETCVEQIGGFLSSLAVDPSRDTETLRQQLLFWSDVKAHGVPSSPSRHENTPSGSK